MEPTAQPSQQSDVTPGKGWWLRPRFSLRTLLILVTLVALFLGYLKFRGQQTSLATTKEYVKHELLQLHWRRSETNPQFRAIVDQMGKEIAVERGQGWTLYTIDATKGTAFLPSKAAGSLDPFERDALDRIRAGESEVFDLSWQGEARYVQAIVATKTCAMCHVKTGRIAVISVRGFP